MRAGIKNWQLQQRSQRDLSAAQRRDAQAGAGAPLATTPPTRRPLANEYQGAPGRSTASTTRKTHTQVYATNPGNPGGMGVFMEPEERDARNKDALNQYYKGRNDPKETGWDRSASGQWSMTEEGKKRLADYPKRLADQKRANEYAERVERESAPSRARGLGNLKLFAAQRQEDLANEQKKAEADDLSERASRHYERFAAFKKNQD
jgi:hypothetical protein